MRFQKPLVRDYTIMQKDARILVDIYYDHFLACYVLTSISFKKKIAEGECKIAGLDENYSLEVFEHDLAQMVDTSDEWIVSRTWRRVGIWYHGSWVGIGLNTTRR